MKCSARLAIGPPSRRDGGRLVMRDLLMPDPGTCRGAERDRVARQPSVGVHRVRKNRDVITAFAVRRRALSWRGPPSTSPGRGRPAAAHRACGSPEGTNGHHRPRDVVPMTATPRSATDALETTLARFGVDRVLRGSGLVRNALRDLLPDHPLTASLLAVAVDYGVPSQLADQTHVVSLPILGPRLATRLSAESGLGAGQARWAVAAW